MRSKAVILALAASLSVLATLAGQVDLQAQGLPPPCTSHVAAGGDLQGAVRSAPPGAVICLGAGWHISRGLILDGSTSQGITLIGEGTDKTVVASDGSIDAVLIMNARGVTLENMVIAGGLPASIYVKNSQDINLRNVLIAFNGIGVHFDSNTTAQMTNSVVAANRDDGVLIRQRSSVTLTDNFIYANGGVGVSAVGHTSEVLLTGNEIADNRGPGFFAGQAPCALLPPAVLDAPACYLENLPAYVATSDVTLDENIIRGNGSTGVVFFPGTHGLLRKNEVSDNLLTGLFVWGAKVDVYNSVFSKNEEHAIEYRAYPDPLHFGRLESGYPRRASGIMRGNTIEDTTRLGNILGGGILSQGADLKVRDNDIRDNAGIGVSFVNSAKGEIRSNKIISNGGSAICLSNVPSVAAFSNMMFKNLVNKTGPCVEASP